ncbi:MAG: ABC transporter ATP-binding protein [Bacilli bacterium]|nr:ABC transporter ATP-binding protein [Bacilli bacterium]
MNTTEKPKNFFGSIFKLLKELKTWRVVLFIALILAIISSIFSIIAPNRLSDLTDEITNGIKPNTEKLEEISTKVQNNYLRGPIVIDNTTITVKDQQEFITIMSNTNEDNALKQFDKLPKSIYSLVKPKMNVDNIKHISIILLILYILGALFNYIQGVSMASVSNKFAKKLRTNISTKINNLPLNYFDNHETGDILSRVTNDVDAISFNLNNSLITLVSNLTLFLGSIVMMFYTNYIMALTAIGSSIFGFIFMFIMLSKSQKYFNKRQKLLGDLNGYIEETYSSHVVVKTYNGTKETKKEFNKLNTGLYKSNMMSQFLSGMMGPFMGFISNFGYVSVCVVGALLVSKNTITFGVIVAFMIYIRLFTNPLNQIAQSMTSLQSTAAASERVLEFLNEKEMNHQEDITKHLDKASAKGEIIFDHVKFGYTEGKTIIKDFSIKVNPGEKIAIVGPTGAGKTTIVNLLMKFYEINDGDILIDGISIKDLSRENIHELFCMVLQDTWLFEGTIKDNLKYNKPNIKDEEIMEACKIVGVDHFIKTLPNGLDEMITDNESISSGQKQLFTIARGMIEDAPFLILDEATSNVDTRTEELVQKAMDKLTRNRTSFIIAHRLSTIKNANLILVMNEGNIIEIGNHEELMKQNGFYANLYNSQFSKL